MNVITQEPVAAAPHPIFNQREILTALLRGWVLILLGTVIGLYYGLDYLHQVNSVYQTQMQVTPVQPPGADSARLSAAAGLASLAGITLPSTQPGSDFRLYLDSLQSRNIADKLAEDPTIMHKIFADQWDPATQRWRQPPLQGWAARARWLKDLLGLKSEPWHPPNGESLLMFLNADGALKIEQDPRRPYMAKISLLYYDRPFSIRFLQTIHEVADNALRQRALARTTQYVAYLSTMLAQVTVAEHRAALTEALSEQVKATMIAKSETPFAAEQFEAPWSSTLPVFPNIKTELVTYGLGGALTGAALSLLFWLVGLRFGPQLEAMKAKIPLRSRRGG